MMCGEIWWNDFGVPFGSEPGMRRPVLIVQNDELNNSLLNTTIVIPLTTNLLMEDYAGNTFIDKMNSGLSKDSVALGQQIITIDKRRLIEKAGSVSNELLEEVLDNLSSILGKV